MRQGFRVIDVDTHVNPSLDALLRYADKELLDRMDDLKHTPIEYLQMGRVFCGIDFSEGSRMTKATVDLVGDHVLMYQSDYPHPETLFPDHTDTVIGWREELGEPTMEKLMWQNAERYLRLASSPWTD